MVSEDRGCDVPQHSLLRRNGSPKRRINIAPPLVFGVCGGLPNHEPRYP